MRFATIQDMLGYKVCCQFCGDILTQRCYMDDVSYSCSIVSDDDYVHLSNEILSVRINKRTNEISDFASNIDDPGTSVSFVLNCKDENKNHRYGYWVNSKLNLQSGKIEDITLKNVQIEILNDQDVEFLITNYLNHYGRSFTTIEMTKLTPTKDELEYMEEYEVSLLPQHFLDKITPENVSDKIKKIKLMQ